MEKEACVKTVINEDGTDTSDFPVNPLKEKWDKLYTPMKDGKPCNYILGYKEDGTPIMNYSCVLCHEEKCQYSNSWKIPDEDKDEYAKYEEQIREYHRKHNPAIINMVETMFGVKY